MDTARCQAKSKRSGEQCGRGKAPGAEVCHMHGAGSSKSARGKARIERTAAERAVATYGLPREVDPHDALLEEVHRTAGHVAWLGGIVAQIEQDGLVWGLAQEKTGGEDWGTTHKAAPNVWLELYHRERGHLVKVAKACIEAGIDERRVQLAEQQGELIVQVITSTLSDLGVDVTEEVASTVGRHLRAV